MKKSIRLLSLVLVIEVLLTGICIQGHAVSVTETRAVTAERIPDSDLVSYWEKLPLDSAVYLDKDGMEKLTAEGQKEIYTMGNPVMPEDTLYINFNAPAGNYRIMVSYRVDDDKMLENLIIVSIGERTFTSCLPVLWKNEPGKIPQDRYGNEVSPKQQQVTETFDTVLFDKSSLDCSAVGYNHKGGPLTVSLSPQAQKTVFEKILLLPEEERPDYAQYIAKFSDKDDAQKTIRMEGEAVRLKSDSYIRAKNVKNASLKPYSTYNKVLNVLDESSFSKTGQKAMWEFEVEESGLYTVAFKYFQAAGSNMACYCSISIDGDVPYEELTSVEFPYHTGNEYHNLIPQDKEGNPLKVYLEKGIHTLSVQVNGSRYNAVYNEIKSIMAEINDLAMSIKKLVGNNTDANRTWDLEDYLPDAGGLLKSLQKRTHQVYDDLADIIHGDPTFANNLRYAETNLRKLKEDPGTLPNRLSQLSEGSGSTAQALGDLLPLLERQPVGFDVIYLTGDANSLPRAKAGFFRNLLEAIKSFFYSFSPKMSNNNYGVSNDEEGLQVWVNRPVQYIEVMQQMVDSEFTAKGGMKINFSIMPNEQKLILANASRTNPDVALGIAYFTPYEFGIRGAAKNLLEYENFLTWYNDEFNLESLIPMCFNHGVYGVSETQDFLVLMYRKDILEKLGLDVPDTWDDVRNMMPTLLRYGMNFNIPASNMVTFKNFQGVSPFIFQAGGEFYSAAGDKTAINSAESFAGMEEMTNLYKVTSLQQYIGSFYNSFRYGQVPLGISGFSSYIQMKLAAPELAGKWDIALAPGTKDEDGVVHRYQMADGTSGMIFENTKYPQESYDFLKWWMSKDTQVEFAYTLQSKFGPEFCWNTANIEAFKELSYPKAHREIILKQWEWQKEVVRHPAGYMVEREVSNVWNDVVVMGRTLRTEMDDAAMESNREIVRKLTEFGYMDKKGNLIKDYPVDNLRYLQSLLKKEK